MIVARGSCRGFPLFLLLLVLAPARAAAQPAAPDPRGEAIVRERLALRAALAGPLSASERAQRWRALAELEERVGNPDLAAEAAEAHLSAVAAAASTEVFAGGSPPDQALARLKAAVHFAVGTGDRLRQPALVLHALAWAPEELAGHRSALARALLRQPYAQVRPRLEQLLAVFAGDPAWQAYLHQHPGSTGNTAAEGPPDEQLAALGQLGAELLDRRLSAALEARDLGRARQIASRLRAKDPWHLRARVLLHLLDDQDRGRSDLSPTDLAAAAATRQFQANPVVVRLQHAHRENPDAPGAALALGYRLLQAHLHHDARQAADDVTRRRPLDPEVRRSAELLAALAALDAGDHDGYQRWSVRNGAERSPSCVRALLDLSRRDAAGEPPAPVARALRDLFAEPFGPTTRGLQAAWTRQAALSADPLLQGRALAVLAETEPEQATLVERCRREGTDADACGKSLDALLELQEGVAEESSPEDLGTALTRTGPINASWLSALTAEDAAGWTALGSYLDGLPAARYGGTPGFVQARLRVFLASGQITRARELYARAGAALGRGDRVAARLVLDQVGRRRLEPLQAARELYAIPALSDMDLADRDDPAQADDAESDDDEEDDGAGGEGSGPTPVARLRHALYGSRDAGKALEALLPLWRRLDGIEGAELAGHVARLAARAKRPALVQSARAVALRLAPDGDVAARLSAAAASAAGDHARAHRLAAQALLATPSSNATIDALVEAWLATRSGPALEPAQRDWVRRAALPLPASVLARLDRALERGLASTVEQLRKLLADRHSLERELDWSPDLLSSPVGNEWMIRERLAAAPADQIAGLARRVSAYLERGTQASTRPALRAWSHYLAGEQAAARRLTESTGAAAEAAELAPAGGGIGPDAPLRLLTRLRDPGAAAFRQKMYRLFERRTAGSEDLPAQLLALAAQPGSPDASLLRALACRAADGLGRARQAIALCLASWSAGDRSGPVAAALAEHLAGDPESARLEGVDGEAFFAQARREVKPAPPASVLHSQALWLAKLQRHAEAARAEGEAWAAGYVAEGFGLEQDAWGWVKHQPLLARYHLGFSSFAATERDLTVATAALVAGEVRVAMAHVEALERGSLDGLDTDRQEWARVLSDLLALALVDLKEGHLTPDALADLSLALVLQKIDTLLPAMAKRHPRSYLIGLLALETRLTKLQQTDRGAEAKALADRFPASLVVASMAVGALVLARRLDEARAVLARMRTEHPRDPRVARIVLPGATPGPGPAEPDLIRNPQAWAASLEAARPDPLLDDGNDPIEHRLNDDEGLELFAPRSFEPDAAHVFAFKRGGVSLAARRFPRVSRCDAAACLREVAMALKGQGIEQLWSRPVLMPAGEGHEGLFRDPLGLLVMVSIPLGPHVFFLAINAPAGELAAALPAIRLFRDSFRPLDAVFGRARADFLRNQAVMPPDSRVRARGRLALARPPAGTGCPIERLLAPLPPAQRGGLLLDLFLISPRVPERRRLLRCTSPTSREVTPLAVAALWDSDTTAMSFGQAAVARHGRATARLFHDGFEDQPERTASGRPESERAAAGLLQVLLALPAAERSALGLRLYNSGQPRQRALALAALKWARDALPLAEQLQLLRTGSPDDLRLLLAGLPDRLEDPWLQATRARLDGFPATLAAADQELAALLVPGLAPALDRQDLPRLARLAGNGPKSAAPAQATAASIEAHALGCRGAPATEGLRPARDLLARWRRNEKTGKLARPTALLGDEPLASRALPAGWSYLRVGRPGTFLAALREVGRRLLSTSDPRVHAAQKMLQALAGDSVGERLEQSGLDLDRPFECAISFPRGGRNFVCTASVRDLGAVGIRLAEARNASSVGAVLPAQIGAAAYFLPTAATLFPFGLATAATGQQQPQELAIVPQTVPAERLVWERLDDRIAVGQRSLARRTELLVARGQPLRSSESLSSLTARRLWVFSDTETWQAWQADSGTASRSPIDPRRLLGDPSHDGATLRGIVSGHPGDAAAQPTILEVTPTSEGVRVRFQTAAVAGTVADIGALWAALPAGAAIAFAAPVIAGPPFWGFEITSGSAGPGLEPPVWLWQAAGTLAFGWYPRSEVSPATRWVSVVPWGEPVKRALVARKLPLPATEIVSAAGLVYRRRGPWLVIGPHHDLVEAAPAGLPPGSGPLAQARVDGAAVRAVLDGLAARAAEDSTSGDRWRFLATVASLVQAIELRGSRQGAGLSIETLFRTPLGRGQPDAALVDEWLRSDPLRNSLPLPRALTDRERQRPVAVLVKTGRPDDLRRALAASRRITIEAAGDQRVRLRLSPSAAAEPPPGPPPASYLATGPAAALLQTTAREIVGPATGASDRARAIIGWVHRTMQYEITPDALDDLEVLVRKRGDCTEYGQLTVALLRALQIPARLQSGFLAVGHILGAHAWVEFHDGVSWREVDPTAGRDSVDAGYLQASVLDVLALVSAGQIEIVAIE